MSAQNKPFRTDLGIDKNGYYCIQMGHTVYAVLNAKVFTVRNEQYTAVTAEILADKAWIMRNINEVMAPENYKVSFMFKNSAGYHIRVNGIEYIADVSCDYTDNLDKEFFGGRSSTKSFYWLGSIKIVEGGQPRLVTEAEISSSKFRRAFKAALNYQRSIDRNAQCGSVWRSRHECLEYKNNRYNTDAFGKTHH